MTPGLAFLDLAVGALVILGVFVAFMGWAVLPLLPFVAAGAFYAAIRYGVPALGRAGLAVEQSAVQGIRWVLYPLAVWAIRRPVPAYERPAKR